MNVSSLLKAPGKTLSFEVFPPKTDAAFATVRLATELIAALRPAYMSVTYGAGGSGSAATLQVAEHLIRDLKVPVVASPPPCSEEGNGRPSACRNGTGRGGKHPGAARGSAPGL